MRLADIHNKNSPRCLVQHPSRGECVCQQVYLENVVHRALRREPVDWRELYEEEVPIIKSMLEGWTASEDPLQSMQRIGIINAALYAISRIDPADFKEMDEVWK